VDLHLPRSKFEREAFIELAGPILASVGMALKEAPCRGRTECKDGLTTKGFVSAARQIARLLVSVEDEFRERLLFVLFHQERGLQSLTVMLDPAVYGGGLSQGDLAARAFEEEYGAWVSERSGVRTTRLIYDVAKLVPSRDFCDYIAEVFPDDAAAQISATLYRVITRACHEARISKEGERVSIALRLTDSHSVQIV